jgi:type IV pilus assembly protein PilY1
MKKPYRLALSLAVATALTAVPPSFVGAEDIDLFVGNGPAAQNPNVLIILDNTSNWSAANQNWGGGVKQGQSELRSLKRVVGSLKDNINVGLMLFTEGNPTDKNNGAYIRFAIRQMTATNKQALQDILGDENCTYNPVSNVNSVTGGPNCIYGNFDKTEDQIPASNGNYSAAMYEAFKYFGGWTFPADAKADPQFATTPGNPQGASDFGPFRYAGDLSKATFVARLDPAAYKTQWSEYNPPISATNNCANNYIIFVGNGFVNPTDVPGDKALMTRVKGDTTHLSMPEFSTTTSPPTTTDIGFWCGDANNENNRRKACTADFASNAAAASIKTANPADSYACVGSESLDAAYCVAPLPTGANARKFTVQATTTTITTAPTGTEVPNPTNPDYKENMPDEWAKYLFTTDVNAVAGQQNVKTYVIDVFKDQPSAAQNSLLFNMARAGGSETQYFQAKNETELDFAFNRIFAEIQSVNTVFAAASLPVSATNRAQNENQVFFGMFRPDELALPRWHGNLKRYQIAKVGTTIILAGQDATQSAVNNNTGFFFDCAKSFWTTDSGSYWNFTGGLAGGCPLPPAPTLPQSAFSDLPDGPQVEKGGAAEVLRRGNNPSGTIPATVSRTMLTCANDGTTMDCSTLVPFADATASIAAAAFGTPAPSAAERTNIINYTRGVNVTNEKLDGNLTQPRPTIHGDAIHSRPLPVNYGQPTDTSGDRIAVFYGTNDGALRAVTSVDGRELWSFVAPEHHSRLKRLYDNTQKIAFPNILAAHAVTPMSPAPAPKEYFFDGSIGVLQNADNTKIWIFPTMRRGGRMIYAFDVTPLDSTDPMPRPTPLLKWRKGCTNSNLADTASCDAGFEDIGQTWSTPNVAFIKSYFSGTKPVIVMGGGYDTCEDTDAIITTQCSSAKGKKVYVLDADTGALIKSFNTDRSVPGDVTLIDTNFDGFVDNAYAATTGGSVYRINFTGADNGSDNSASWTSAVVAQTASNSGRKFLFPPAALVARDASLNTLVFLSLGSGDRERPLLTNYPVASAVQNRFFVFVDKFDGTTTDLDTLQDNTAAIVAGTSPSCSTGWRLDLRGDPAGPARVGEQTVTSSLIAGGRVFWNTSRATSAAAGTCDSDLGEARGYSAGLFCGEVSSTTYVGGGLPISPVLGTVTLADGSVVTVCIGCAMKPGQESPFTPGQVNPAPAPTRTKMFWRRGGDK